MATVHIVNLSPLIIPKDSHYKRDEIRPKELQQKDYKEQYDYKTLAYDVFQSGNKIIFSGPPLYGLESIINDGLFKIDEYPINHEDINVAVLDRIQRNQITLNKTAQANTFELNAHEICFKNKINHNLSHLFEDKNVLLTVSKNNNFEWIADWIVFHYVHHKIDCVLIYDNQSSEYKLDELQNYLRNNISINIDVYLIPWNFPYGPLGYDKYNDKNLPWDSDFCQYSAFEHAKERFLSKASGVLNADIDELVMTKNKQNLFNYLKKYPYISYKGRWMQPIYNNTNILHHSFFYYDINVPKALAKWCISPTKLPPETQWKVHSISVVKPKKTRSIYFAHMCAINWDNTRTTPIEFSPLTHKSDDFLINSMEEAFNMKILKKYSENYNFLQRTLLKLKNKIISMLN